MRRIAENGRDNIQCACAANQIIDVSMADESLPLYDYTPQNICEIFLDITLCTTTKKS